MGKGGDSEHGGIHRWVPLAGISTRKHRAIRPLGPLRRDTAGYATLAPPTTEISTGFSRIRQATCSKSHPEAPKCHLLFIITGPMPVKYVSPQTLTVRNQPDAAPHTRLDGSGRE